MSRSELFKKITQKQVEIKRPLVISIDGPAGAGKTTLAKEISEKFLRCEIIHMDDLYRGWLLTLGPNLTRELESILDQLLESGSVSYRKFDWHANELGEYISFEKPEILILEGVGSGQGAIAERVDIKVWIDIPIQQGLNRVLERDGLAIKEEMERFLDEQEAHFTTEQTRERSDFHITGN